MRNLVAFLMALALAACAGLPVKTVHDPEADFSRYRSYTWTKGVPAGVPSLEEQIHVAIDRELPFQGLHKVDGASSSDLYVSTYVSVEKGTGTLRVDLVDARSGKLAWRGLARRALDRQVSEETVRKAVREIFRGYPPED